MTSFLTSFCKDSGPLIIIDDDDFGGCFEKLVLVCPVYILLSCVCAYYIVKAGCTPMRSGNINRMWIIYTRILFQIAIIFAEIVLIYQQYSAADSLSIAAIVVESLILLSWCLSSLVIFLWRKSWHSVTTGRDPDLLVVCWFLALLSCSFELHSAILSFTDHPSALDNGAFSKYESYNIFIRWSLYLMVMILQIPKANIPTTPRGLVQNSDEEAGSSRGHIVPEPLSDNSFSFFSRVCFHWVTRLFSDAQESHFPTIDHLTFTLPPQMNPIAVHTNFKMAMRRYSTPSYPPLPLQVDAEGHLEDLMEPLIKTSHENDKVDKLLLVKSLNKAFGWSFWPLNVVKLISAILELSSPVVLNLFLRELESDSGDISISGLYLGILVLDVAVLAFINTHLEFEINKLKLCMKGSLITELYSKILSVNLAGLKKISKGQIINLASKDADQVTDHIICFFEIWYMPLKLSVTFYLLYHYIGISFLAGVGFCVLLIPINQVLAKLILAIENTLIACRDERLKLMQEIIKNIKSIKMFSWEEHFIERINKLRSVEILKLRQVAYLDAMCVYFWAAAPPLISFLTLLTFALVGGNISASIVFTTLALVGQVVVPLNALPWVIMGFIQAWISVKRFQNLLELPEVAPNRVPTVPPFEEQNVIEVDNCSFFWDDPSDCCLTGINFQVNKGELMVVMGQSGSGKSSLLLALSQELNLASGELRLKEWREGSGLVLQDPWIKSGTVKETILDGVPYDLYWYESVVHACALDKDIKNFPEGDNTPVGTGGGALSGGQRLRLTLARAVYKNKQVYLIDDLFSGLDSNVALHIYENCINGLLANKTRIICTHHERLSSAADTLMILEKGRISYIGLPQTHNLPIPNNSEDGKATVDKTTSKDDGDLNKDEREEYQPPHPTEERAFGSVDITVYKRYSKAAGFFLTCLVLFSLIGMQTTDSLANWWLSVWVKGTSLTPKLTTTLTSFFGTSLMSVTPHIIQHPDSMAGGYLDSIGPNMSAADSLEASLSAKSNTTLYLKVYGSIIAANSCFVLLRAFTFAVFGIAATKTLHENLLKSVMSTAVHFFDKTPVGVIINRFAGDIYAIDADIPFDLNILLALLFMIVGTLVLTTYGIPYIVITIIPLIILYYFIQKYYRTAVTEIKRLYSMAQSPLFSHFEETIGGIPIIHASRMSDSVQVMGVKLLHAYQRTSYCLAASSAWLNLRLQLLAAGVLAVASGIVLIEMYYSATNVALLALALTYALTINDTLTELVRCIIEVEMRFVSAERVLQYVHGLPIDFEPEDIQDVDLVWPENGCIEFHNVSLRYKDCSTRALNHISFRANAGEKIGIVGRTGAGKSSIFMALFRLNEIETGQIIIDGTNIHEISSKVLRQKLMIIPQKPLIISGSIRSNVDPFTIHNDDVIYNSLKRCSLEDFVRSKGGLDQEISEDTISAGQRQLFSLARGLLNKSKILCLDEVSSNIDFETDKLIQDIIRNDFATSTILCVAHRLQNILDFDRILVMSHAGIAEDGPPQKLLDNHKSLFYKLARTNGLVPHNNKLPVSVTDFTFPEEESSSSSMSDVKFDKFD